MALILRVLFLAATTLSLSMPRSALRRRTAPPPRDAAAGASPRSGRRPTTTTSALRRHDRRRRQRRRPHGDRRHGHVLRRPGSSSDAVRGRDRSTLARAGFPLYGAASPVLVLVHRFLKPDGEPFVERTVKLLALASSGPTGAPASLTYLRTCCSSSQSRLPCLGGVRAPSHHSLQAGPEREV